MFVSISAALAVLAAAQTSPAAASDPLETSVVALATRFEDSYQGCGLEPLFSPRVAVETNPSLVSYDFASRTMRTARYEELPEPIQGLMSAWAEAAGAADGAALFGDIFNSLLVPHEMGHWTQHLSRRAITLDRWESEVEANRIALAFWRLDPEDAARLPARVEAFTGFLGQIPSPVPEGQEARDFFNANYDSLDAMQYGWFQGAFMREAWERRDEADFCGLARLNTPAPAEAFEGDPQPEA